MRWSPLDLHGISAGFPAGRKAVALFRVLNTISQATVKQDTGRFDATSYLAIANDFP